MTMKPAAAIFRVTIALLAIVAGRLEAQPATITTAPQFAEAIGPREWSFPTDHGQHSDFQTEWWYFTGNVEGDGGRFGYQLTIFRRALQAEMKPRESKWASRDIYLGHVALSDVTGGKFLYEERMRRPALDMAGASTSTLHAWLENWRVTPKDGGWKLEAATKDFAYDFDLKSNKPPVFNGPGGRDSKGARQNQASYYYSMTRMETSGTITVGGKSYRASGWTWMDHEFGSNQLGSDQNGWDWFSLQFSDNTELMIYQLRRRDGTIDASSGGTYTDADGKVTWLHRGDIKVKPMSHWKSPETTADYPSGWEIKVPTHSIDIKLTPRLKDQELRTGGGNALTYWEGAIEITGTHDAKPVTGFGYAELTGYAHSMGGRI